MQFLSFSMDKYMLKKGFQKYILNMPLNAFSLVSAIIALMYWNQGLKKVAIASIVCSWGGYLLYRQRVLKENQTAAKRLSHLTMSINKYAYLILAGFITVHLFWSGFIIFINPFEWGYNHGDATYFSQTLWNLAHGLSFENSYFTFSQGLSVGEDPRYCASYAYVSIFTLFQNWLSVFLLTPLYALFPHPPMHIYAPLVIVILIGLPGMFWAVQKAGGSKTLALFGAVGFSLLPQVEIILFFKGYFDVLALAVMPWVFGALFARKWFVFYAANLCLSAIGYPYVYMVMVIGLVTGLFFNAPFQGIIAFLIGFFMMKWDTAVFMGSILPYYKNPGEIPSFFKAYILERTIGSLIVPIKTNINYIVSLLQAGAFLPIFALRKNQHWNLPIIGLLVIPLLYFVPMLFRSVGWEVARNSNFIVPLYICAFKAYIDIMEDRASYPSIKTDQFNHRKALASICLFFSMTAMILAGNDYRAPSPLASHYPWGSNANLAPTKETIKRVNAMKVFDKYISIDASLAFRAEGCYDAVLTNRRDAWHIGREPVGVQYYAFVGEMNPRSDAGKWIEKLLDDKTFRLVHEDSSIPLIIFENLEAISIPRDESLLGWRVLLGAFRFLF